MEKKIKILRIITRLNIGGPSIHVSLLTKGLDPRRFESVLIGGSVSDLEGDMGYVAKALGVRPVILSTLGREIKLSQDIKCLLELVRILDREKPDIVHTHTAKAGTLGRIAVFIHNRIRRRKILVVHTFHGHVLHGYFSRSKSQMFIWAERLLAKASDSIIAISESQTKELIHKYQIAPARKFQTVSLGFDLAPFFSEENRKGRFRARLGVGKKTVLIGIIGRLVEIKNHKMFLDAAKIFIEENPDFEVKFIIIGDGELRRELMFYTEQKELSDHVIFLGWEIDLPRVYADLDILALTSINEGTPVSIIEAMASSVPVISTDAGGVQDLLGPQRPRAHYAGFEICARGLLCQQGNAEGLAKGIKFLLMNPHIQKVSTNAARLFVERAYAKERLFREIESIYLGLLKERQRDLIPEEEATDSFPEARPPLKVLQVYKDYYPPVIGGVEGHINLLANGLRERGVKVEVLVSNTRPRAETEIINGIRITKAPELGRFASAPLNVTFHNWLKKLGKEVDILHFHFPNPTGEISSLLARLDKKIVVTYHSDIIRQAKLARVYSPLLRQFLGSSKTIIATSPNYVQSSTVLAQFRDKCTVIPFGIDLTRFEPRPDRVREVAAKRQIYGPSMILFIGRFRYYKGLYALIGAMKKVCGKLVLIGSGPMEAELKNQVAADSELQKKIFFLGELSDQEVVTHLQACDIFVLPSIVRSEAFGIVLLEAMACNKPLVSTELGTGTSFVNQHKETGLVVPPNNVEALAGAINYLLANPDVREKYGKAARQRVEKYFNKEKMIEDVIRTYQEALN
ncbi:MAG: glycosyltransferase [Desulfobacteraceae bacterium]|nr:glycosyltransferase [Desulfobacteraceae bacterium]